MKFVKAVKSNSKIVAFTVLIPNSLSKSVSPSQEVSPPPLVLTKGPTEF